jgi:hypothetical protein
MGRAGRVRRITGRDAHVTDQDQKVQPKRNKWRHRKKSEDQQKPALMALKVLLPFQVFLEKKGVRRIVIETLSFSM